MEKHFWLLSPHQPLPLFVLVHVDLPIWYISKRMFDPTSQEYMTLLFERQLLSLNWICPRIGEYAGRTHSVSWQMRASELVCVSEVSKWMWKLHEQVVGIDAACNPANEKASSSKPNAKRHAKKPKPAAGDAASEKASSSKKNAKRRAEKPKPKPKPKQVRKTPKTKAARAEASKPRARATKADSAKQVGKRSSSSSSSSGSGSSSS